MKYVYVLFGGAFGSFVRFLISDFITIKLNAKFNSIFPFGTLSVNLIGSFIIGFLYALLSINGQLEDKYKFLLFIGFLGGFTTFSSFALENLKLINQGLLSTSILYILLSNFLGIGLAFAGYFIASKIR